MLAQRDSASRDVCAQIRFRPNAADTVTVTLTCYTGTGNLLVIQIFSSNSHQFQEFQDHPIQVRGTSEKAIVRLCEACGRVTAIWVPGTDMTHRHAGTNWYASASTSNTNSMRSTTSSFAAHPLGAFNRCRGRRVSQACHIPEIRLGVPR